MGAATSNDGAAGARGQGWIAELKSHPRGLLILSATEFAERFSYYGMTALVVLYMIDQLFTPGHVENVVGLSVVRDLLEWRGAMSDQAFASILYGWYAGLVYLTPLFGGWIADRWLGARRTVTMGAILMVFGHLAMSFDQSFLVALALLIVGSGCLKGNISAQVAPLYGPDDDAGRARGFTIFSTGINIGAVAGPLATGALAQAYGWHAGFACAAVLMTVSLMIYLTGQRHLPEKAMPDGEAGADPANRFTREERHRLVALFLLITINVLIIGSYYQITVMGLVWVDEWADLSTPAGEIPASWFSAIDAFASVLVAAPLLAMWSAQGRRGREPDSIDKVWLGSLINGLAPLVLIAGIALTAPGAKVAAIWPVAYWVLAGIAFMFYWPITLGIVAARAPRRLRSRMMGAAMLSAFGGNLLVGWVGSFYELMPPTQFWLVNVGVGMAAVALIGILRPYLRRYLTARIEETSDSAPALA